MADALEQLDLRLEVAEQLGRELGPDDRLDRDRRRRVRRLPSQLHLTAAPTHQVLAAIDDGERAATDLLANLVRPDPIADLRIRPRLARGRARRRRRRTGGHDDRADERGVTGALGARPRRRTTTRDGPAVRRPLSTESREAERVGALKRAGSVAVRKSRRSEPAWDKPGASARATRRRLTPRDERASRRDGESARGRGQTASVSVHEAASNSATARELAMDLCRADYIGFAVPLQAIQPREG